MVTAVTMTAVTMSCHHDSCNHVIGRTMSNNKMLECPYFTKKRLKNQVSRKNMCIVLISPQFNHSLLLGSVPYQTHCWISCLKYVQVTWCRNASSAEINVSTTTPEGLTMSITASQVRPCVKGLCVEDCCSNVFADFSRRHLSARALGLAPSVQAKI